MFKKVGHLSVITELKKKSNGGLMIKNSIHKMGGKTKVMYTFTHV